MSIKDFIDQDNKKLEAIIAQYPKQIPCPVVADYMGADPENIRAAVANGQLGVGWKKPGKLTGGNCIPTSKFIRWMLNMD